MPRYNVLVDGQEFDITLEYRWERYFVSVNGQEREIMRYPLGETRSLLLIDKHSLEVDVRPGAQNGERVAFMWGMEIPAEIEDFNLAKMRKAAGLAHGPAVEAILKAPMPGLVLDVRVKPGDKVSKGQPLVIIEAMKMENIIRARGEATVKVISTLPGSSVEKGDALLEFE
ncbi:MAG TPA: biotin/lipoyl-containing protein [Candidatus Acidoferrum sp.]|nr:biotin/lipoyl-containing protein [Candidatus Acidoferrum sp.]